MNIINQRSYDCYFHFMYNGKLHKGTGNACWSRLQSIASRKVWELVDEGSVNLPENEEKYNVYISKFKEAHVTDEDRARIIQIINKITPCKIVKIEDQEYIKYTMIRNGHYDSNLVLLNIIRMLWLCNNNMQKCLNLEQFFKDIHLKRKLTEDFLTFIMRTIKKNVIQEGNGGYGFGDHSIVYKDLKVKTIPQLMNDNITSCQMWVQQK